MNELDEPLRLLRQRGHWALEITKLVAIERDVLSPQRRRVTGTDSVVRHLRERFAPSLVRATLDLLVTEDDGNDRAFALEGDQWVQLADVETNDAPGPSHAALLSLVKELRVELSTLRAMHEAVRHRLALLERRSLSAPLLEHARSAPRGASRRDSVPASLRPAAKLRSTAPATAELGAAPTQAAIAPLPPAPVEAIAAPAKPRLLLPTHADVVSCLKQLLGSEPELRVEKSTLPQDLDAFYVSRIVDSNDQEVGAILLDRMGGMELGGRLLGFPTAGIAEQAKSEPNSDMLDAMNEIVNNLGGFINRANPDLRVRVRPLQKLEAGELAWLPQHSARLGNATKLGGRLWLAGCPG